MWGVASRAQGSRGKEAGTSCGGRPPGRGCEYRAKEAGTSRREVASRAGGEGPRRRAPTLSRRCPCEEGKSRLTLPPFFSPCPGGEDLSPTRHT